MRPCMEDTRQKRRHSSGAEWFNNVGPFSVYIRIRVCDSRTSSLVVSVLNYALFIYLHTHIPIVYLKHASLAC